MTEDTPSQENPYEPPSRDAVQGELPKEAIRSGPLAIVVLLVASAATALSFALPPLAVFTIPASLMLLPAAVRFIRVREARSALNLTTTGGNLFTLLTMSFLAAIPIAVASSVLFCCVCTPVGVVSMSTIRSPNYGPSMAALAVAVFLGLLVALWFGQFLLKRLSFLSEEVKEAMRQNK